MSLLTTHAEIEELGNGRQQQAISLKRIAYYRNGSLTRLLNRLGNTGDPNLPVGCDEAINFRVRDRLAGQSPIFFFGRGQSSVRISPLGTNNVDGVVSGQIIAFPDAWNSADLRLTIAGHRLQKDVLLKTGHPSTFSFRINAHQNFDLDTLSSADFRVLDPVLYGPKGQIVPLTWVKSVQGGKTILTVTLPAGDYAGWTLDPTLTLQPDGTDGLDSSMRSKSPTVNGSGNMEIAIGEEFGDTDVQRTLMRFNLGSLPANAVISSATLSLYATVDSSNNARTCRIYRQKRVWVETEATWNIYSTGNNWQTAGGFGANDCEQTDIGSRDFTATETLNEFKNFTLTAKTKTALDLGNGWLLKMDTETDDQYQFASSDNATAANRPKLVIAYRRTSGLMHFQGWRKG